MIVGITFVTLYFIRCAGVKCGYSSHCFNGVCLCDDGYTKKNDICVEICTQETCQDLNI